MQLEINVAPSASPLLVATHLHRLHPNGRVKSTSTFSPRLLLLHGSPHELISNALQSAVAVPAVHAEGEIQRGLNTILTASAAIRALV